MRSLLDVNVLIALFDADHSLHAQAMEWFGQNAKSGWASCPLTQNGCIRVMSHPGYPNSVPVKVMGERLRAAVAHAHHEFWADDVSALDEALIDMRRVHGAKQLTDVYLLALAVSHGGRFVTFDRSLPSSAVLKAQKKNRVVI